MTADEFVPAGFDPPTTLATDYFRLEPPGPQHNEADLRVTRGELEMYVRHLESRGYAAATVARRFGTGATLIQVRGLGSRQGAMRSRAHLSAWGCSLVFGLTLTLSGCSPSAPSSVSSPSSDSPQSVAPSDGQGSTNSSSTDQLSSAQWSEDVDALDAKVRQMHPDPFAINTEKQWSDGIAALKQQLPKLSREDATVALMRQVALLDTHSGIFPEESGFHLYPLVPYRFSDGLTVIGASDQSLVGARITAIGSTPIDKVMEKVRPLVNADNNSGYLDLVTYLMMVPEILHSLGLVSDTSAPRIALTLVDGTTTTVDPAPSTVEAVYGDGAALAKPQTVPLAWGARDKSEIAWRVDRASKSFVVSYNNAGTDASNAIAALKAAFDQHKADRVVLDMRYARGGSYDRGALTLVDALKKDPRINRRGHLIVIIGRECVSATTTLASNLDRNTAAVFVGEPTPARANNFLNEQTFQLPRSGLTVHVPTTVGDNNAAGDHRNALYPDITASTTSVAFLSGRDPVLAAALKH